MALAPAWIDLRHSRCSGRHRLRYRVFRPRRRRAAAAGEVFGSIRAGNDCRQSRIDGHDENNVAQLQDILDCIEWTGRVEHHAAFLPGRGFGEHREDERSRTARHDEQVVRPGLAKAAMCVPVRRSSDAR